MRIYESAVRCRLTDVGQCLPEVIDTLIFYSFQLPQFLLILLEQSSHGLLDGLELLLDLVDADIVLLALVNLLEDLGNLL